MPNTRDDFTEKTKIIMAQRVAYKCSNPDCGKLTVGPNTNAEKATIVGVAAHITAAAPGGPRFDALITKQERKNISNGIWLCHTCSTLIDKDPTKFPLELLEKWKEQAEGKAWGELVNYTTAHPKGQPKLVLDIVWSGAGKYNRGLNFAKTQAKSGGKPMSPLEAIYNNELVWDFNISIYNNSSYPAFNVKIERIEGQEYFTHLDKLPKVNNIPPLANIDLEANYRKSFIGTGKESLKLIRGIRIPPELVGTTFKLICNDEEENIIEQIIEIEKEGIK